MSLQKNEARSSFTTAVIADDSRNIQKVFSDLLEYNHIKVLGVAKNGKEAVYVYQSLKPDVIFLDILMPKYDGIYAIKEIKKLDPKSRIIAVTADLTSETFDILKKLGVEEIIYKPFDMDRVLKSIKKIQQ